MFVFHFDTYFVMALRTKRKMFMFILLFVDTTYQLYIIKILFKHVY